MQFALKGPFILSQFILVFRNWGIYKSETIFKFYKHVQNEWNGFR